MKKIIITFNHFLLTWLDDDKNKNMSEQRFDQNRINKQDNKQDKESVLVRVRRNGWDLEFVTEDLKIIKMWF